MASDEEQGVRLPFGLGESRHYFAETIVISAVFYLVLFGMLVVTDMTVPTPELVFIALFPFFVVLITSGRLNELRVGDLSMKFQQAIQGNITPDAVADTFDVQPEEVVEKADVGRLKQMISERRSTLAFRVGARYSHHVIEDYIERNLRENPAFKYILFIDRNGRFRGFMRAEDFVTYLWVHEPHAADVVDAIQNGNILDEATVIMSRIEQGSTLGEARRKFRNIDEAIIAVIGPDEKFYGVLSNEEVNETLLTRLMEESTA